MIKKLKSFFTKEKKIEEVKIEIQAKFATKNSRFRSDKKLYISKQDIYDFFIKEGIDSSQSKAKICEYFGIDCIWNAQLEAFFMEFCNGDNKILDINSGGIEFNLDIDHLSLTKEAKREIKINLIINDR